MRSRNEKRSRLKRQKALKRELRQLKRRASDMSHDLADLERKGQHAKDPIERAAIRNEVYRISGKLRQLRKQIDMTESQLRDA